MQLIKDGVARIENLGLGLLRGKLLSAISPTVGALAKLYAGGQAMVAAFTGGSTANSTLSWGVSGQATASGMSEGFSGTVTLPATGGSGGFFSGPAVITITVSGSDFSITGTGFGSQSGVSCSGGASGSSGISSSATAFSAGGSLEGNLKCQLPDGSTQNFPISGSFSALAQK